jgi:hypothetical protein
MPSGIRRRNGRRKVVEEFVEDRVSRGYSDDDEDRLAS